MFDWIAGASAGGLVLLAVVLREVSRRVGRQYEYRWETFAVRGPRGQQYLHLRQSEIASLTPLTLWERLTGWGRFKQLSRSSFSRKLVIRSNIAHAKPVIVSWEGRPIAGIAPKGYKVRPGASGRKG